MYIRTSSETAFICVSDGGRNYELTGFKVSVMNQASDQVVSRTFNNMEEPNQRRRGASALRGPLLRARGEVMAATGRLSNQFKEFSFKLNSRLRQKNFFSGENQ